MILLSAGRQAETEEGNKVKILEDSDGDGEDDLNVNEMDTDINNIPSNFRLFRESFQNVWSPHQPNQVCNFPLCASIFLFFTLCRTRLNPERTEQMVMYVSTSGCPGQLMIALGFVTSVLHSPPPTQVL